MSSGRIGRSSLRNVGLSQLKIDLLCSVVSRDVVDWCRLSRYGCMDMERLEQDVIAGVLGVYLLIDNDGGGRGCWKFVSGVCSVKPNSEGYGSGEKDSTWSQDVSYNEGVVVLHEGSS